MSAWSSCLSRSCQVFRRKSARPAAVGNDRVAAKAARAVVRGSGRTGLLAAALALAPAALVQAAPVGLHCEAHSPVNRMAVVELYTSEGCSSCPPADRWLSALNESALADDERVLPLALHVDYWDYIGWKDRFADPTYTSRQRQIAAQNKLRNIYTPQVVMSGSDTRKWYDAGTVLSRIEAINAQPSPVALSLSAMPAESPGGAGPARLTATVMPSIVDAGALPAGAATVHLMLFENGLASNVSRGENAGRKLTHDRVVRHWARPAPLQADKLVRRTIELPADSKPDNMGLAVFVQGGDGQIVQAAHCALKTSS